LPVVGSRLSVLRNPVILSREDGEGSQDTRHMARAT
jgi:hypothetical protein